MQMNSVRGSSAKLYLARFAFANTSSDYRNQLQKNTLPERLRFFELSKDKNSF